MGNTKSGKSENSGNGDKAKKGGSFSISNDPLIHAKTEGDVHKYEVAPEPHQPPAAHPAYEDLGALPETYGDTTLFLVARDPQWLYTYWDVAWDSFPASAARNAATKVFLKVFYTNGAEQSAVEINLDAKNWYLPVPKASASYYVELGFQDRSGKWVQIARSNPATTPSDSLSAEEAAEFATVPLHLSFQRLVDMVKTAMAEGDSLISALSRIQGEGRRIAFEPGKTPAWTEEQRQVLVALLGKELIDRVGLGSAEIDQLIRKELQHKLSTESASELAALGLRGVGVSSLFSGIGLWGPEVTSLFSGIGASWSAQPFSGKKPREFFMHVNAEVIFYGGTHPDAEVTIDGEKIHLNPDGTFRFHFKFPDGDYDIPIVAVSPDKLEERSATLSFRRATERKGDVGHTAQPKALKKPMGKKKK